MRRKLTMMLLAGVICLLVAVPALAATGAGEYKIWATPAEYEEATGNKIEKYSEAPELRALVAAGDLPPVEERLPKNPLVARGFDGEIGNYGGTLRTTFVAAWWILPAQGFGIPMIQGHYPFGTPYPNLVESYEMDSTAMEWTFKLREGLKWSDGAPLTADDYVFTMNDISLNKEYNPVPSDDLVLGDEVTTITKIDDYTFKYNFPKALNMAGGGAGGWSNVSPKHYLQQFHPSYADKDELQKVVDEGQWGTWVELMTNKMGNKNLDKPTLSPWVIVQGPPDIPEIYKRNPYYWVVDEEGNQLPYMDYMDFEYMNQEVENLRALVGELDYAEALPLDIYPELKKAEKEGSNKAIIWKLPENNADDIEFNFNVDDPVKREIFRDKRFRFAVSYAIDREVLNDVLYLGIMQPWQVAPSKDSPFYHERLAHTAIEFDPDKANALLDEMGLDKRDADGMRLAANGEELQINYVFCAWNAKVPELVIDMLEDVGLRGNGRLIDDMWTAARANEPDALFMWESMGTLEGSYLQNSASHWVVNANGNGNFWCQSWYQWLMTDGKEGEEPMPEMLEAMEYYQKAQATFDLEEQKVYMEKLLDIAAENLWTIGTLAYDGGYPYLISVNPHMRNFPASPHSWWYGDWGRVGSWFYEE